MAATSENLLVTIDDAAARVGLSRPTIYRLMQAGELHPVRSDAQRGFQFASLKRGRVSARTPQASPSRNEAEKPNAACAVTRRSY